MTQITPVIMIGGSGTRLWPLSRRDKPKQFHALLGERTLLQTTVDRVSGAEGALSFTAPVLIAGEHHETLVRQQLPPERIGRLVLEPMARNTAPCAAVAALLAADVDPEQLILLLPSDHHIADERAFRAAVALAAPAAAKGELVTFGVRPTGPATGYGYILAAREGFSPVQRFVEKPDLATAREYVEDGRYLWNAGIFLMRADVLLAEMKRFRPDVLEGAGAALARSEVTDDRVLLDRASFAACPSDSIDYAIMERTDRAMVQPLAAGWSDIGDFDALWTASSKDSAGNVAVGEVLLQDASNTLVISDGAAVAVAGVSDLAIVVRDGMVLVLPRARAQDVKKITESLSARGVNRL